MKNFILQRAFVLKQITHFKILGVVLLLGLFGAPKALAQYTAIPDANFELALIDQGIDSEAVLDGQVLTTDISGLTSLDVNDKSISDLTGIQDFVSLTSLSCFDNQLTSLDVSNNTALDYLSCGMNQLTSLDLSTNTALTILVCQENLLTSLNLSTNTVLDFLDCSYNQIISLDVSNNTALTFLEAELNQLTSLNVSTNTSLTALSCWGNLLTSLDVSSCPLLYDLLCFENQLTNLNLGTISGLGWFECSYNLLNSLNVCNNPNITYLACNDNQLSELDLRNNTALSSLYATNNNITNIYVTNPAAATANTSFYKDPTATYTNATAVGGTVSSSQHIAHGTLPNDITLTGQTGTVVKWQKSTSSDFSTGVTDIASTSSTLTGASIGVLNGVTYFRAVVDLSGACPGFAANSSNITIDAGYTAIPDTNFEQALFDLGIDTVNGDHLVLTSAISGLTSLDVSSKSISDLTGIQDFVSLTSLDCYNNLLTSLNVSANTLLTDLYCDNNQLTSLDVSSNTALVNFSCMFNQLTSLDVSACTAMEFFDCSYNLLSNLNVSTNSALLYFYCYFNHLTNLNLSGATALVSFDCDTNQLTSIDVSANTALSDLSCWANQLTSLDVSNNIALTYLGCDYNDITQLNVCSNINLIHLVCNDNVLTSLDLRNNPLFILIATNNNISNIYVTDPAAATANTGFLKDPTATYTNATAVGGTVSSSQHIAHGTLPSSLTLTGQTGTIVKWQKSTSSDFSTGVTDIASTSSTLTGASIGVLNGVTYFRAVVDLSGACPGFAANSSNITIDAGYTAIPDTNFEQALFDLGIDTVNGDHLVLTSAISGLTSLDVSSKSISDLTGIQDFVSLTFLDCSGNLLTSLNVIAYTLLTDLYCDYNQLTSLDVSSNTALVNFSCSGNQLTSLDVSACTAMEFFDCSYNLLSNLNVSTNSALLYFYCYFNHLTNLNLSGATALVSFDCDTNQLTSIDVSANTALSDLSCWANQLTSLDVSNNIALTYLGCNENDITQLNVCSNINLIILVCNDNVLTSLDLRNNPLFILYATNNNISNIYVTDPVAALANSSFLTDPTATYTNAVAVGGTVSSSQHIAHGTLPSSLTLTGQTGTIVKWQKSTSSDFSTGVTDIASTSSTLTGASIGVLNGVTYFRAVVDLSGACPGFAANSSSITIDAGYTAIPDTNFEQALFDLGIDTVNGDHLVLTSAISGLTSLDVSSKSISDLTGIQDFVSLTSLDCFSNQLTSLDVSNNTALDHLECGDNQLTSLDLSTNTALTILACQGNLLTSLNISTNTVLDYLDCSYNQLTSLDVSNNTALTFIEAELNQFTSLNVSTNTSLTALSCWGNLLTSLDVSSSPLLYHLLCSENQLTNLNLGTISGLGLFDCSYNLLNSLNVCNNPNITYLACNDNQLSELDLRNNTALSYLYATNNNITNIYVINIDDALNNPNFHKDPTATYANTSGEVGGTVSSNQTVCFNTQPAALSLNGYTGSILKWQKSSIIDFSTGVTDIANTTATLSAVEMGNIVATTYFRALVGSACFPSVSNTVTIEIGSSTTWNGTSWSNGVPTSITSAIVSGNLTVTAPLSACNITVSNGAAVIVESGQNLNISGAVIVESGSSLTFENNSNLHQTAATNTNTGNIVVKRETSPLKRLDYVLWSSPVTNQTLQAFSPATLSNRFYSYNPDTNFYTPVVTPAATNFATATSYLIRLPNTHPDVTPTIWNSQFQGVPNNGTYDLAVTQGTYNAIGNPYPETISANAFIIANGIGNGAGEGLYFWRKTNNSANSSYATYTLAGGTANEGGLSSVEPNGVIQIGQGFITKTPNNKIYFTNAMRIVNNNNQFFRNTTLEKHRIWLNLTGESLTANQLLVSYMTGATNGVDPGIDGTYINDSPIALNSYLNNGEYIIQGRALPFTDADVVPLSFKTTIAGNYTIAIDHVDGLFSGNQNIYIRDIFTGIVHDLKQSAYSYATTTGTFNNRFELVYASTPLSTQNPIFNDNAIVIYKQNEVLNINSGNTEMKSVRIFDVRGRLIYEQKAIKASTLTIKDLTAAQQVLIVQITAADDQMVSKKVVY